MAYRAEIEISVKGQRQLEQLRSTTNLSAKAADSLRDSLARSGGLNQTLQSYSNILSTTSRTLKNVVFETEGETKAIREYVTALGQSNEAAARQNRLIEQEITLRNKAKKSIETRRRRDEFVAGPGRTIGAEKSAQRAAKDSARRQREFKEIEGYNRSIFKIEQGFNKQIRDYEIDTLLKTFKLEENLQDRAFRNALDLDRKEGAAFDRELRRRVQATEAAARAASQARRLTGQSSPIGGAANIPGSPAARRRTANRQAITRGAGIGLATANIPGSNIAQAAAIGAGFGGPKGAAIAASVAAVSQAIAGLVRLGPEVARTEAQLSKLGIALRGILGSQSAEGFKAIDRAARDFNQPILDATKNFTQLSAAATANGNSVKQTETLYRALSAATKATGGDAQDLSGVLRAATQVISKGVVRSEELRGQIGDRLPGAFQLFAQATNRSAEELQKALEQGEVSADEFVTTFADFILNKYEPAALRIGASPAEAGARLTKALEDANRAAGPLLLALGAKFQDFATEAVKALTPLLERLDQAFNLDKRTARGYARDLKELVDVDKKIAEQEAFREKAIGNQAKGRIDDVIEKLEQRRGSLTRDINDYLGNIKTPPALTSLKPTTEDDTKGTKTDQKRAAAEARRVALRQKLLNNEIVNAKELITLTEDLAQAELDGNKAQVIKVQGIIQELGQRNNIVNAVTREANEATKQLILEKGQLEIDKIRLQTAEKLAQLKKTETVEATKAAAETQKGVDSAVRSLEQKRELLEAQLQGNAAEVNARQQVENTVRSITGLDAVQKEALKEKLFALMQVNDVLKQEFEQSQQLKDVFESISTTLASTVGSAVDALTDGTRNLGESFKELGVDLLRTIAKMLIMQGIAQTLGALGGGASNPQGIFSFLARGFGQRAEGGPVSANKPYLVGERGPEIVVPGQSGTVIPNDGLGGTVVNITNNISKDGATSTNDSGSGSEAMKQLNKMMVAVIQREQRPGGVLSRR